jgi:glycosyltransferase involved in cell wall biosynthesis
VISIRHAPGKRGSREFAAGVVRSWASPLPVDLWRWRIPALRAAVAEQLAGGGFELVVADFLTAVPNLPEPCPLPVLLFEHNVEHLIWRRLAATAPLWQRPLIELEWRKMRRFEARASARADLTVAVSEADAELLAGLAPAAQVRPVPTGVDTDYFAPNGRAEVDGRLVFVGSMDWYPNEDATLHLIDSILPLVRRELPDAALTVVGRNPSPRLRAAAEAAGATVTGMVPDVRPHVGEGAVVVVPLRVGGGTRLKIFEALAMGKAVVSTAIGAEGLPLVSGEHFLEADEPAAFAAAVVALLRDEARRHALGAAGRELVVERYSWDHVGREFARLCEEAVT